MYKVALVTGGSRGIGADICRCLAKSGYRVAINYNNSQNEALALKQELSAITDVEIFKADVSSSAEVEQMFLSIEKALGNVTLLVNNAGIAQQALFTHITDEMWQKMLDVNLTGVFNCSRRALPNMISAHSGNIINISSMWGQVGASMEVHYSAAKAGVIGLTKALAKEVGLSGVRVNAVAPGAISTDMLAEFTEEDKAVLKEQTPLYRLGEVNDVAKAVCFLASEDSSFITGQVISVNGGFVV